MKSYRDLEVWQRAIEVAADVFGLTQTMHADQRFALIPQMHRSAVSIASNIAEGFGRETTKDYIKFLVIARGSVMELETQITIAVRAELVEREHAVPIWNKLEQTAQMLNKLIAQLRRRLSSRTTPPKPYQQ